MVKCENDDCRRCGLALSFSHVREGARTPTKQAGQGTEALHLRGQEDKVDDEDEDDDDASSATPTFPEVF